MDAGVSASGGVHCNGRSFDFGDNLLDGVLDGWQSGLDLPTVVVGAVVGEGDADAAHGLLAGTWFFHRETLLAEGAEVGGPGFGL